MRTANINGAIYPMSKLILLGYVINTHDNIELTYKVLQNAMSLFKAVMLSKSQVRCIGIRPASEPKISTFDVLQVYLFILNTNTDHCDILCNQQNLES